MKKSFLLLILFLFIQFGFSQTQTVTATVTPTSFEETTSITITFSGSSINEASWLVTGNALYLWAWSFDLNDLNNMNCPTNGTWTVSNEANRLIYNSTNDTYSITFVPQTFYNRVGIGRIGFLLKPKNGTGTNGNKKSQDFTSEVGAFQVNLTAPLQNSTTILSSGASRTITATNTNGTANYVLKSNGTTLNSATGVSSYSYNNTNITSNQYYALEVTQGTTTVTKNFTVLVNPNTASVAMPTGLVNGINYNTSDNPKATLVLDAPLKDYVFVAGSFNSWSPTSSYAMKKDPTSGKFWLELTGLVAGTNYSFQYWVVDQTPIANSPALVKVADPCSTTVLSPWDDSTIPATSYPNLPTYPAGQEREVTLLKTGQTPYNWQVTNFTKPNKDKLVVYELLIRDFDANRNFQDVINRIQYFKDLGINAIQLMPIMEFEGNESWGYNTAFHMALDKFYGTPEKFKELVDVCHQNGIAIILDIAFNHAFGRNPMVRMWMNDPDGDGWGGPSSENPYFNTVARHSYSVGEDFNHSSTLTRNYVKQTIKHWITEYKIDGFRWDLTKGFTQNCTASDQTCTNIRQQDRIDVLKEYADYSWSLDNNHYVIFEHLGGDSEEQEWANYRIGEGKGIMMWGELFTQYKELALGFSGQNISRMSHTNRGFTGKRLLGYPESHDKDRVMYEAITYGNTSGTLPVRNNLTNALNRMGAIGATSILVPGPKMIWHFGELGNSQSIYTCANGSVNDESNTIAGDCKLDTKAQVQWTQNWLSNPTRAAILSDWSKMIKLKTNEPVFVGDHTMSTDGSNFKQRIHIFDTSLASNQLKYVVVLANFDTSNTTINPNFPTTGYTYPMTWYDLMDNNNPVTISSATALITVNAGKFRVFGNQPSTLSSEDFNAFKPGISIYPNPVKNSFAINQAVSSVEVYTITGQLVASYNSVAANQELLINGLESGIYLVKIKDQNNLFQTKKIVIE
jgi:1,4-alpha-glucan branching enzyme